MIEVEERINSQLNPYGKIVLEVKEGDRTVRKRSINMESFVENYWKFFYDFIDSSINSNLVRWDGSTKEYADTDILSMESPAGNNYAGIAVGSGTTPLSIDDNSLDSLIPHGTSIDTLEYSSSTAFLEDNGLTASITRALTNDTGSSIDVNEVCLSFDDRFSLETTNPCMIARDVFSEAITINDGQSLSITYEYGFAAGSVNRNMKAFVWNFASNVRMNYFTVNGEENGSSHIAFLAAGGYIAHSDGQQFRGVSLGIGDTPVTEDDINLDNKLDHSSNGLYKRTQSKSINVDTSNNTLIITISGDFVNNTGSEITIREMGLFGSDREEDFADWYLMRRIVLNTPVTIQDGVLRTAQFKISYSI